MPFIKKNSFDDDIKLHSIVDLTSYVQDIVKILPRDIRSKVEILISTGLYKLQGNKLVKISPIQEGEHILSNADIDIADKSELIKPIISEPISEEEDDDIPESWKVPYVDPDDYPEEPEQSIVPIESLPEVSKFEGLDKAPELGKQKQKRNKGMNMKGIKKEMRFGELMYEFVHKDGSIEFLPKDIREEEKKRQNGTYIEPEPAQPSRLKPIVREPKLDAKPDTKKYDVIQPTIMTINSFEKEQFAKRLKYTYNHPNEVIEEYLFKISTSDDQEYIMNEKLDMLERYEADQKKRKEIENYDFFAEDDITKKK